jgi:hypothetical protein
VFFEDGRYMRHDFYNIIIDKAGGKIRVFKRDEGHNLLEETYDFADVKALYRHTQGRLLSIGIWPRPEAVAFKLTAG